MHSLAAACSQPLAQRPIGDTSPSPRALGRGRRDRHATHCNRQRHVRLTSFLQKRAGLAFYNQLWCASKSCTPLHNYAWESLLGHSETAGAYEALESKSQKRHIIKFTRKGSRFASHETTLMTRASAESEYAGRIYQYGPIADTVFFGICELCVQPMTSRITERGGIVGDVEFRKLSNELVRGISDIYKAGITHLALQVRREWPLLREAGSHPRAENATA